MKMTKKERKRQLRAFIKSLLDYSGCLSAAMDEDKVDERLVCSGKGYARCNECPYRVGDEG